MTSSMFNRSLLVTGSLWALASVGVVMAAGFVNTVVLTRLLTPSEVGSYFAILAAIAIASTVGSLGLSTPINAFIAEVGVDAAWTVIRRGFIVAAFGIAFVSFLFLVGVSEVIQAFTGESASPAWWILAVLSAAFVFRHLSLESLISLAELKSAAFVRSMPSILVTIGLVFVWTVGLEVGLGDILLILLVSQVSVLGIAIALISRRSRNRMTREIALPGFRRYLSVGLPWLGRTLLTLGLVQAGALITAATSSAAEAAEFGTASRIAVFVALPYAIVAAVVPPFISRYWVDGDRDRLERLMRAAATASSVIAMMALMFLTVFGKPLLSTFFGTGYEAAWSSMVVLAIGYSVQSLTGQAERVLALVGGERVVLSVHAVAVPVAVVAMVLLGNSQGSLGVALASAGAISASALALSVAARRTVGITTWAHTSVREVRGIADQLLQLRPRNGRT